MNSSSLLFLQTNITLRIYKKKKTTTNKPKTSRQSVENWSEKGEKQNKTGQQNKIQLLNCHLSHLKTHRVHLLFPQSCLTEHPQDVLWRPGSERLPISSFGEPQFGPCLTAFHERQMWHSLQKSLSTNVCSLHLSSSQILGNLGNIIYKTPN